MATEAQVPSETVPLDPNPGKDEEMSFSEFMSPANLKSHELHFMQRYLNAIMKKRDHDKYLNQLSPDVHKKLLALKKLQVETMELSAEFHRKVHVIEKEFLMKHDAVYQKRSEIINGNHVPDEKECELSEKVGGLSLRLSKVELDADKKPEEIKGIPDFWLTVLKLVPQLEHMVREYDEPILKHLTDIRVRSETEPVLSFTLEFHFTPNEYFEDPVLEKVYFMKCAPEDLDPFSFDGPEIYKSKGMAIKWKEGKNVTMEKKEVDGKETEVKVQSFFNFFDPPEMIEDPIHPMFHEINGILEDDFEIGFCLKDRVIPRAVLYYTGEAKDEGDGDSSDSEGSNLRVVYENSDEEKTEGAPSEDGDGDKKD